MRPGDLVLSMGAGDITTLPQRVIDTERADAEAG
jgi:UDP-N-acetylmuramate-alanine ligase